MLKRNVMKGLAALAGAVVLMFFQNCSEGFVAQKFDKDSGSAEKTTYVSSKSQVLEPNQDLDFALTSDLISGGALYQWSHRFNGLANACVEKSGNRGITYTVNCPGNGDLQIDLVVNDKGTQTSIDPIVVGIVGAPLLLTAPNEIQMTVLFEIPMGTGVAPWNSVVAPMETFIGQAMQIRNADSVSHELRTNGRPCVTGQPITPGQIGNCLIKHSYSRSLNGGIYDAAGGPGAPFFAVSYDGIQLYAQNCSGCHGNLMGSAKTGKRPSEILNARATQPTMQTSAIMALTQRQIEAISYALGGR